MCTSLLIRPSDAAARKFRSTGVWRDSGQISELRRWRDETPHAPAIKSYRADGDRTLIDYAEYARCVERFAGALYELGVRPGQVVACQLPNWWQAQALLLAAIRLEAVVAPIMTTIRPRELERMLHRLGPERLRHGGRVGRVRACRSLGRDRSSIARAASSGGDGKTRRR